ncbi:hypothetical protein J4G33_07095 [Actinotalea sp. BY-33]|uniref:Uncharacterized protein n=1 Tax=Actinotalea soli TaxID=2819234 RepID=A0A939RTQ0_9CELL|nr:hypothetical protein [Actinotalea soli]MBO1751569.1 hypothetical protein [Actinotalea soli]
MAPVVVWTVLALLAAVLVMAIAGALGVDGGGPRQFLRDLRAGLRRDAEHPRPGLVATMREESDDEAADAGSLDDLFSLGYGEVPTQQAYLSTRDLLVPVERASKALRESGHAVRR